jgi:polar amino acid transport system permease protein
VALEFSGRTKAALALLPFWLYLLGRWLHDWNLAPGANLNAREPFLPSEPLVSAGEALRNLDVPRALGGVLDWFAGGFDFLALGLKALPQLAAGAWLRSVLTVVSILAGLGLAMPLSVARVYSGTGARWLSLSFTELIRGTPLLTKLFVLYFGLSLMRYIREVPGVRTGWIPGTAVFVAFIGFMINSAAYYAEYIGSALHSVETGQLTAARAIGFSKLDGIRHVVLPQWLRFAIPGWSNELVYPIKYSSLASFIPVGGLFIHPRDIGSDTYRHVGIYSVAAIAYLAMAVSASP